MSYRVLLFLSMLWLLGTHHVRANGSYATSASGNMYASGSEVSIANPVPGDLVAFGGRIRIDSEVAADAALAGGSLTIDAPIGQDARVAAGSMKLNSSVNGDLVAAGGQITLNDSARIHGSAWLAGSDVVIKGEIAQGARIAGRRITLSGTIAGDVTLAGEEIRLLAGSAILGNLTYSSARPLERDPQARISGKVTQEEMPPHFEQAREGSQLLSWLHPIFMLSMLITGLVLHRFFPAPIGAVQKVAAVRPGRSLLLGLALVFTLPPVALLLMMTVLGIPLGFALLLLYPLLFLAGYVLAGFIAGGRIAEMAKQSPIHTLGKQALFLALGLVLLNLVLLLPFVGIFIVFLAVAIGIGSAAEWMFSSRGSNRAFS